MKTVIFILLFILCISIQSVSAGGWMVHIDESDDRDKETFLLLLSDGNPEYPVLCLRCRENKLNIFTMLEENVGKMAPHVISRLDSELENRDTWHANDRFLFLGTEPISYAKKLMGHEKLYIQVMRRGERPLKASFSIVGLSDAIAPFKNICGLE